MNYTRVLDPVQESDCFVRMRNSDNSRDSLSIRLESPFDLLIFHRKPHVCSCCDSRSVCVVDFPCKLHGGWCKRAAECLTEIARAVTRFLGTRNNSRELRGGIGVHRGFVWWALDCLVTWVDSAWWLLICKQRRGGNSNRWCSGGGSSTHSGPHSLGSLPPSLTKLTNFWTEVESQGMPSHWVLVEDMTLQEQIQSYSTHVWITRLFREIYFELGYFEVRRKVSNASKQTNKWT